MRLKTAALAATSLLLLGVFVVSAANAAEPQSGTWKLNTAKSKYAAGTMPKSNTLTIEADDKTYKLHAEGVDAKGNATMADFSATYDGKDVPSKGLPYGDTVSLRRINANTVQVTMKKDGKALVVVTSVVSKDGKTRTSKFNGKDEAGHPVHNVAVYEKQ